MVLALLSIQGQMVQPPRFWWSFIVSSVAHNCDKDVVLLSVYCSENRMFCFG
uniref:Uncharacterized protein n=1 Tax=Anguilla anguilla TaxID=7936 RepID=A0A0E9W591_ANGAN